MLTHPTLDRLEDLGLHGMAMGFKDLEAQSEARSLEHAEWLALLLDREVTLRRQKRFDEDARLGGRFGGMRRKRLEQGAFSSCLGG